MNCLIFSQNPRLKTKQPSWYSREFPQRGFPSRIELFFSLLETLWSAGEDFFPIWPFWAHCALCRPSLLIKVSNSHHITYFRFVGASKGKGASDHTNLGGLWKKTEGAYNCSRKQNWQPSKRFDLKGKYLFIFIFTCIYFPVGSINTRFYTKYSVFFLAKEIVGV